MPSAGKPPDLEVLTCSEGRPARITPAGRGVALSGFRSVLILIALLGHMMAQTKSTKVLNSKGMVYRKQGRYLDAERAFAGAYRAAAQNLGTSDPRTMVLLHNWAELQVAIGKFTEAERCLRQTLSALEAELGPEHPLVGRRPEFALQPLTSASETSTQRNAFFGGRWRSWRTLMAPLMSR